MNFQEFLEMATQCSEHQSKTIYLICLGAVMGRILVCEGILGYVVGYFANFTLYILLYKLTLWFL
jgi:hypothetical protein